MKYYRVDQLRYPKIQWVCAYRGCNGIKIGLPMIIIFIMWIELFRLSTIKNFLRNHWDLWFYAFIDILHVPNSMIHSLCGHLLGQSENRKIRNTISIMYDNSFSHWKRCLIWQKRKHVLCPETEFFLKRPPCAGWFRRQRKIFSLGGVGWNLARTPPSTIRKENTP